MYSIKDIVGLKNPAAPQTESPLCPDKLQGMRSLSRFSACILIIIAFWGCAAPQPDPNMLPYESLRPGVYVAYRPALQPGATFDTAKKDLSDILASHARPTVVDNSLAVHVIRPVLKYSISEKMIEIQIESGKILLPYDELVKYPVLVAMLPDNQASLRYNIYFKDRISFWFRDGSLQDAKRFTDALFFMQQLPVKEQEQRLALFEPIAAQYRELKIKPPVSEEQRKHIVLANLLTQRKDYTGAIDLYLKVIDLDPVSYPGAYFNLALLSAQLQQFKMAISYMKQYLQLEPEAKDARSARDKIYEWEFLQKK